jgi:AraC-like DNA-binding protein
MSDIDSAVADLQSRWLHICDLDRAEAVHSIQQDGMSLRELARNLKCSPSLLSHLLRAAQAPAADRARARRGEMSTRALARAAATAGTRCTERHPEAIAFERERAAFQAIRMIMEWLSEEGVTSADHVQIIEQARLHVLRANQAAVGWQKAFLEEMLLKEVVRQRRGAHIETSARRSPEWFALRLALWTLREISDDRMRDKALKLAIGDQLHS